MIPEICLVEISFFDFIRRCWSI